MKLTLAEPKYLKDSIGILSDLVNEARFKVTKDALELVAMDPANVAMVIFKLWSACFTEYDVKKDTDLCVDLANLKQILRRVTPSDMITLTLEDNQLKVQLKGNSTRTFSLPLLEVEDKTQRVPDLVFPIKVQTTTTLFNGAIEDADIVAESVSFEADKNAFVIMGENDLSQAKIEIKADENTKITATGMDKVRSKYSVEYLKKVLDAAKLSSDVIIQFNKDYPLRLDYIAVDKLQFSFILAPRVEND